MFKALEHPEYRRFWLAQAVSLLGSWIQVPALAWLVVKLYDSDPASATVRVGLMNAIQWTPSLVLSLFAGVILDRVSRKTALLAAQSTLMLGAFALGLTVLFAKARFEVIAMIAFLIGLANVFDIVARQSLMPSLVPRDDFANAVALNSLNFNATRVLGFALFGVLVPFIGLAPMFLANAASFLVVIPVIASLHTPPIEPSGRRIGEDVRIGLTYVFTTPAVRTPILLLAALSLTVINFPVITPTFARFALGQAEAGFGLMGSSFGIGAALGAVLHASRPKADKNQLMVLGAVLLCGGVGLLALAPNVIVASVCLAVAGAGMIVFTISTNSSVQLATPDRLRGRVMSVYTLVFAGMTPIGALIAGGLMAWLGARGGVVALAGIGLAAVGVLRPRRSVALEG